MAFVRNVRMRVPAGSAKPGPAIGQALGPLGINMMEFCKKFNEESKEYAPSIPLPVELSAYSDRSFTFVVRPPETTWFLKRCAGITKGGRHAGHEFCGKIGKKALYEIALIRKADPENIYLPLDGICRSVAATAESMGLEIIDDRRKEEVVKEESDSDDEYY